MKGSGVETLMVGLLCFQLFFGSHTEAFVSVAHPSLSTVASLLRTSTSNVELAEEEGPPGEKRDKYIGTTPNSTGINHAKFKKKRFLMMQDVRENIKRGRVAQAETKAYEMMERWKKLYQISGGDEYLRPTIEAYNLVLNAISKAGGGGQKAEQYYKSKVLPTSVNPNIKTFTILIDAYGRQSQTDPRAAEEAERILFQVVQLAEQRPDLDLEVTSVTIESVLNAWTQRRTVEGAERAQEILMRLEQLGGNLHPTLYAYTIVIDGWAKVAQPDGTTAQRAQKVLNHLLQTLAISPDTVVFNACINAWATSRDPQAGSKSLELLERMKTYDCEPDIVTYISVLSSWSRCGHINAAKQAEKILQDMIVNHRQDEQCPPPTTEAYNNVLNAWSKSKLPDAELRAEKILQYMIQSNNPTIAPDVYSFTSVLDALAKSRIPTKTLQARKLLDIMIGLPNLAMSQVPFNAVLNAAAFSRLGTTEEQQRQALQIAVRTFSQMRSLGYSPDEISYGNLLKSFNNLMPPGDSRSKVSLNVFQQCCQDGHVNENVWNQIRKTVPKPQLGSVVDVHLGECTIGSASIGDLPREWRCNTRFAASAKRSRKQGRGRKNQRQVSQNSVEMESPERPPRQRYRNFSEQSYQSGRDL